MAIRFYTVLDQVFALLRSRGRVTYNALQLHFRLDDAHLTILKEELLYAHPQVVDDEGRGLIWTSDGNLLASRGVVHYAALRLYEDLVSALLQREGRSRIAPSRNFLASTRRAWSTCGRRSSSNSSPVMPTARVWNGWVASHASRDRQPTRRTD